jgi:hypothetical protein
MRLLIVAVQLFDQILQMICELRELHVINWEQQGKNHHPVVFFAWKDQYIS